MNKSDLASLLAKDLELSLLKAQGNANTSFDTMSEALKSGHRIEVRGCGSFSVRNDVTAHRDPHVRGRCGQRSRGTDTLFLHR